MKQENSNSTMHLSFIVPTLNEEKLLPLLLDSIQKQLLPFEDFRYEVIIVDANSSDATVAIAHAYDSSIVTTTPGPVSASRNLGASRAKGEILAFIDADCELPKNWILSVIKEFAENNVVATGAVMSETSSYPSKLARGWFELAHRNPTKKTPSQRITVQWLATFNLAVKREVFETINGFETSLVTCEDVEFSYRLQDLGQLSQLADCAVIHHGESHSWAEFYRREAWRSRGTLAILTRHWKNPREVVSSLLPVGITLCIALSLTGLVLMASNQYYGYGLPLSLLAPATLIALSYVKGVRKNILYTSLILGLYYLARTQGSLMPFKRVSR